jgi:hypothetical protein
VTDSARQVVTAAGDGATAAIRVDHYIADTFKRREDLASVSGSLALPVERRRW